MASVSDLSPSAEEPSAGAVVSPSSASPKPRCALKVAVIGNRRFAGESDESENREASAMRAQARTACSAVWRAVCEGIHSALATEITSGESCGSGTDDRTASTIRLKDFFSGERPRLAVLSGLAAGADQIGAETALDLGQENDGVSIELETILPFSEEDYPGMAGDERPEFRPDEAETLRGLAARARQVVRLDGSYLDGNTRRIAYLNARDALLQHADLLVAVYDPMASARPAGTVETLRKGLRAGQPVVAILVSGAEVRIAVYQAPGQRPPTPDREWSAAHLLDDGKWRGALKVCIARLLCLPQQIAASGEDPHECRRRLDALEETVGRMRLLYGENQRHRLCRDWLAPTVFAGVWKLMLRTGAAFSRRHEFSGHTPHPDRAKDAIRLQPFAVYYDLASDLSETYMRTYRGAFVLSFVLAGLAVAAAVMLLAVSLLTGGHPPAAAVVGLGGLKIGVIVVLLGLERVSHQARYQEHATDFRYLAELFRQTQWLVPAGIGIPAVELPAHVAPLDPRRGWTTWLLRAVVRSTTPVAAFASENGSAPPPREVMCDSSFAHRALEEARTKWVHGQVIYHWSNARKMHDVDDGLEVLAKLLLWIVLVFASVALGLELLLHYGAGPWADLFAPLQPLVFLLGAGAAALPAFIAALGGIMFQSEARRLKLRSEAMYHSLRTHQAELERQIEALATSSPAPSGEAWKALQRLRDISSLMIAESADWKILYQTHEVHAG